MLTIHIGLPKTATTFLQHLILKPALGTGFVHRTRGKNARLICRRFKDLMTLSGSETNECYDGINSGIAQLRAKSPGTKLIVVSDENISGRALEFWEGQGVGPQIVAERLRGLSQALSDSYPRLRVMIGVRRQDRWLASRYAESSTTFATFDQADFDRRMNDIAGRQVLGPVFDWLDYHKVHSLLLGALGPDNVLMFSMERLSADPETTLSEIDAFVGGPGLVDVYRQRLSDEVAMIRNTLSAGDDTWRLRRDDSPLHLKPEIRERILHRLAGSNQELANLIPTHFE